MCFFIVADIENQRTEDEDEEDDYEPVLVIRGDSAPTKNRRSVYVHGHEVPARKSRAVSHTKHATINNRITSVIFDEEQNQETDPEQHPDLLHKHGLVLLPAEMAPFLDIQTIMVETYTKPGCTNLFKNFFTSNDKFVF